MMKSCEITMTTIRLSIISSVFVLLLTGCEGPQADRVGGTPKLATPVGMAEYLKDLPAVRKVEPWSDEYAPGITITTEHYDIHTTLLDPLMLRQVPGFVESAYRGYQSQLPEPIDTKTRLTIYLFGSRQEWEDFTKKFVGRQWRAYMKIKKGAYYLNGACVAYNIGRKKTFSVIAHEGWHQFNSRHFAYRLPSWLDEGIATLFETSRYDKGRFYFEPHKNGGRLGGLRRTILTENMIPLKKLISLNPGYVIDDRGSVLAFYSQAYALVRFLREEDYGKRLGNYQNLLMAGLRGEWPLEPELRRIAADRNIPLTARFNAFVSSKLFSLYIGQDIEQIEAEYIAFCKKSVYRVRLAK
ncbi:MAG: hypothetical protein DRP65_09775 [Planctomycetota bacterium]|nr:MAG: hypothetical protein DRP65_09775 [Planctomycetota bacterium]